jgi:hypothetical protein
VSTSATLLTLARIGLGITGRAAAINRRRRIRNMAWKALLILAALLCFAVALILALVFLYMLLRGPLGPAYAALVLAGTLLVIGGGLLILMRFAFTSPRGAAHQVSLPNPILPELAGVVSENRTAILLGLAIAGALAGSIKRQSNS